jgi:non-homologous end joining protein Ku
MQIKQFIKAEVLSPALFDRAYFIAPKDYVHAEAFSIMRKALTQTNRLGVGRSLLAVARTLANRSVVSMTAPAEFEDLPQFVQQLRMLSEIL